MECISNKKLLYVTLVYIYIYISWADFLDVNIRIAVGPKIRRYQNGVLKNLLISVDRKFVMLKSGVTRFQGQNPTDDAHVYGLVETKILWLPYHLDLEVIVQK